MPPYPVGGITHDGGWSCLARARSAAPPFAARSSLPRKRRWPYPRLLTRYTGALGRRRAAPRAPRFGVRHRGLRPPRESRGAARAPRRAAHERGIGRLPRKGAAQGRACRVHGVPRDRQAKTEPGGGIFSGGVAHLLERHRYHKGTPATSTSPTCQTRPASPVAPRGSGGVLRRARYTTGRRDPRVRVLRCYR